MLNKYKHIIWDWNGTLLDDVHICVEITNSLLLRRETDHLSYEEYRQIFTFPIRDYYVKAGVDFRKYSFETLGTEWMEEYEKRKPEYCLFAGVNETLSAINSLGKQQSVLSAYPQATLVEIITHHGLNSYFTHIRGLNHIYAHSKVELGKELVQNIGLGVSEMVFIGDTIHDYEVACEIGAECILFASGHQNKERLLMCGVPVFDSISALKDEL